jgi:hypothetical protein
LTLDPAQRIVTGDTYLQGAAAQSRLERSGMSKYLVTAAAVGVWLAIGVGSGGAATNVISEPVSFALPAGQCADLPAGVSVMGSGTAIVRAHSSVDAEGRFHEHFATTITGVAADNLGGTYRFNYHQSTTLSPAADFPFVVHITDHFNLVGNGPANKVHTFFNITLLVTGPGSEEFLSAHVHGDPETCDPL